MPSSAIPTPIGNKPSPGTESEHTKPGFNLLRRESGFSIASLAASLPMGGRPRSTSGEESGQQLITVSRPASLRSKTSWRAREDGDESQDDETDDTSESAATGDEESEESEEGDDVPEAVSGAGDARSIRSFENMLSASKERGRNKKMVRPRKTLSDRLASVSALATSKVRDFFFDFEWGLLTLTDITSWFTGVFPSPSDPSGSQSASGHPSNIIIITDTAAAFGTTKETVY